MTVRDVTPPTISAFDIPSVVRLGPFVTATDVEAVKVVDPEIAFAFEIPLLLSTGPFVIVNDPLRAVSPDEVAMDKSSLLPSCTTSLSWLPSLNISKSVPPVSDSFSFASAPAPALTVRVAG